MKGWKSPEAEYPFLIRIYEMAKQAYDVDAIAEWFDEENNALRSAYREQSLYHVITGNEVLAKKAKRRIKRCDNLIDAMIRKAGRRVFQETVQD